MVQTVQDQLFFHVTADKPYKKSLEPGQQFSVGQSANPFFGFYEETRQYPVTLADGSEVQLQARTFLTKVRDGHVQCPELPKIAWEVATHFMLLSRELIMEEARREVSPEAPSRQRCLYVCSSRDEAHKWQQRIGDDGKICIIKCTGKVHRADASLLPFDSESLSRTRERARVYWRGEAGETPEWEILFEGQATVIAFGD